MKRRIQLSHLNGIASGNGSNSLKMSRNTGEVLGDISSDHKMSCNGDLSF